MNFKNLKKVGTPLIGIGGKLVKVEESVKLLTTLGEKDRKRIVGVVLYSG